jgi:SAM-dependent methyltransferase
MSVPQITDLPELRLQSPQGGCQQKTVLNLGCGRKHREDAVNLDVTCDTDPDVVHNLNHVPWPFPDNRFSEVLAFDVLEHLGDIVSAMEQIHRVCQNAAVVKITVPHFSCANAFTDPTHRRFFGWFSFHYFTGENEFSFYSQRRFRRRRTQLIFVPTLVNKIVWRLANRYPQKYEQRWAWMFPAWYLYFEIEVVKESSG